MKLKEYIPSFVNMIKLWSIKKEKLVKQDGDVIPVIVSLTSIPSRLNGLHITIRSLLLQSVRPEKIVIWLNESLKDSVPESLKKLEGDSVRICFSQLDSCHLKLVETIRKYKGKAVVTCDDDLMYPEDWLGSLYEDYKQYPRMVVAHRCRRVSFDFASGMAYKDWVHINDYGVSGYDLMALGYGGVLYPPNMFHHDVCREDIFMRLTPKADDLWFKTMSLLNGVLVRKCSYEINEIVPRIGAQRVSLKKTNVNDNSNIEQWKALCDYYNLKDMLDALV